MSTKNYPHSGTSFDGTSPIKQRPGESVHTKNSWSIEQLSGVAPPHMSTEKRLPRRTKEKEHSSMTPQKFQRKEKGLTAADWLESAKRWTVIRQKRNALIHSALSKKILLKKLIAFS